MQPTSLPPKDGAPNSCPRHTWILLLQSGFQLGVGIRSENRPITGRFQPFAVGCAEPKPYWEPAFANVWMVFQGKTFVQFDLQLRWRGLAIFIARRFCVLQLQFSAIEPGNARGGQFIQPAHALLAKLLQEHFTQWCSLGLLGQGQSLECTR